MGSAMVVMTLGTEYDVTRAAGMKALLAKMDGVDFVDFNYTNNKLTVKFNPDRASPFRIKAIAVREKKHRVGLVQRAPVGAELDGVFEEGMVD
jgi:hypothetical protein